MERCRIIGVLEWKATPGNSLEF